MHECYAMQILETKKIKTTKKNGHKEQRDEAQGPCQKDSIRSSFFASKTFQMQLLHLSYYSYQNTEQLQEWNKGLKPLPINQ